MDNKKNYDNFLRERKRTRFFFNLVSIVYPVIEHHLFPEYRRTIKKLNLPKGLTVLDVGTGSGILAAAFSKQGYRVKGYDFSEKLLKRAQKKFPEIIFKTFDLYDISQIPSNSYDIVSSGYLLHGLSPHFREIVLQNMSRISSRFIVVFDYCCRGNWFIRFTEWIEGPYYSQYISTSRDQEFDAAGLQIERSFQTSNFGNVWLCTKKREMSHSSF